MLTFERQIPQNEGLPRSMEEYSLILAEFDLTDRLPFRFRPTKSLKIPRWKVELER